MGWCFIRHPCASRDINGVQCSAILTANLTAHHFSPFQSWLVIGIMDGGFKALPEKHNIDASIVSKITNLGAANLGHFAGLMD